MTQPNITRREKELKRGFQKAELTHITSHPADSVRAVRKGLTYLVAATGDDRFLRTNSAEEIETAISVVAALEAEKNPGELHGPCNIRTCRELGADYYNSSTMRHYCRRCALRINETCPEELCKKVEVVAR